MTKKPKKDFNARDAKDARDAKKIKERILQRISLIGIKKKERWKIVVSSKYYRSQTASGEEKIDPFGCAQST